MKEVHVVRSTPTEVVIGVPGGLQLRFECPINLSPIKRNIRLVQGKHLQTGVNAARKNIRIAKQHAMREFRSQRVSTPA